MASTILVQMWVGRFQSKDEFFDFFGEDPEYYAEENEDLDDYPLSKFIATQGETWFDHDFFEPGFNDKTQVNFGSRFSAHSWSHLWGPIVDQKLQELGKTDLNAFALMVVDNQPGFGLYRQVPNPQSYSGNGIELVFLGEFELRDSSI